MERITARPGQTLCRGKKKDTGEWMEGHLLTGMGRTFIVGEVIDYDAEYIAPEWWWVIDPATLGQFTGETDKTGQAIFQGDVLRGEIYDATGRRIATGNGVVGYDTGRFGLWWGHRKEFCTFTGFHNTTFEVIGNIHDNHDLLIYVPDAPTEEKP